MHKELMLDFNSLLSEHVHTVIPKHLESLDLARPIKKSPKNESSEYINLENHGDSIQKAEDSSYELRQYIDYHQQTSKDIKDALQFVPTIASWLSRWHPLSYLRLLSKMEVENTPLLIESFRARKGFIPKQFEDFPKYENINEILKTSESSEGLRIGKMVFQKEDFEHFKELCQEWEKQDPMTCRSQIACLRHAPQDVVIKFLGQDSPSVLEDKITASRTTGKIRWNPFEKRDLDRIHTIFQLKKGQGLSDMLGDPSLYPIDLFKHEVQHLMTRLYAPYYFNVLVASHAFSLFTNLEEARVILGYESSAAEGTRDRFYRYHNGCAAVTFEHHGSGEAVIPYRNSSTNNLEYIHPEQSLSGYVLSADSKKISLKADQGVVEMPTDALMAHNFFSRIGNVEPLQNSLELLQECSKNKQPVSISLEKRYGKRIADIKIARQTMGLATILPSMEQAQRLRLQQGTVRTTPWQNLPIPTSEDMQWGSI